MTEMNNVNVNEVKATKKRFFNKKTFGALALAGIAGFVVSKVLKKDDVEIEEEVVEMEDEDIYIVDTDDEE